MDEACLDKGNLYFKTIKEMVLRPLVILVNEFQEPVRTS